MIRAKLRSYLKSRYLTARAGVLNSLVAPSVPAPIPQSIQSILIVSQRRLGDVSLEIPAIRAFRHSHADTVVGVVIPHHLQELVRWACNPDLCFDWPDGALESRKVRKRICGHQWQVVVDLTTDYHLFPARLASATRAPLRIGFENAGRGRFFNLVLLHENLEHMGDLFERVFRILGIHAYPPELPPIPMDPASLPKPNPNHRLIGLHPGGTHATQRWSLGRYAMLAGKICSAGDACLVLGSAREAELVESVVRESGGRAVPFINRDGPLRLAATLKKLDVLICNNSGPLHLAGLLGIPTLSFMGPSVKQLWWPRGSPAAVLRRDHLPCIGCNSGHCFIRTHACMELITVEDALNAYRSLAG